MNLSMHLDSDSCKKNVDCHMLPCNIQLNGYCKISKYFKAREESNSLIASLRGYPLEGLKVSIPANYKVVVLRESKQIDSEARELRATSTCNDFYVWNWDKNPAVEHKLEKSFQWIEVASALHASVSESSEGLSSSSPKKHKKRKLMD